MTFTVKDYDRLIDTAGAVVWFFILREGVRDLRPKVALWFWSRLLSYPPIQYMATRRPSHSSPPPSPEK
jgi:hypothetical protein